MHPMQKSVAKEELFKAVERALVTAVTQVPVQLICLHLLPLAIIGFAGTEHSVNHLYGSSQSD